MRNMEDIKTLTKSLIDNLGVEDALITITEQEGSFVINIDSREEFSLIGRENEKFDAITHILKRILAKKLGEDVRVVIDINGVLKQKDEHLKQKSIMMAERAKSFKIDVELDPMTSYERMLVHSHLANISNIKTESVGEGRERRVVIRFVDIGTEENKV